MPLAVAAPAIIPAPPQIAANSYILIDANSGKVITEANADAATASKFNQVDDQLCVVR